MRAPLIPTLLLCFSPFAAQAQSLPADTSWARASFDEVLFPSNMFDVPVQERNGRTLAQVGLGSLLGVLGFALGAGLASTVSDRETVILSTAVLFESVSLVSGVYALAEPRKNGLPATLAASAAGILLLSTGNDNIATAFLTLSAIPPVQLALALPIIN